MERENDSEQPRSDAMNGGQVLRAALMPGRAVAIRADVTREDDQQALFRGMLSIE
jgi:hypothetical protein